MAYRAFIQANIHPQNEDGNENNTYVIYIPEHISYDTKQNALDSKTRWDYSFGFDGKDVVILIRHITVIDDGYGEVRSMPEFCYDYDTFVKLGGWVEHVTREENVVNVDKIHKNFNDLYRNLFPDTKTQIPIEPTDRMVVACNKKDMQIPIPIHHIVQNSPVPSGNYNCNRPLVDDSFYEALSALEPGEIKGKTCHITANYVSVTGFHNNAESVYYDARMQRVVDEAEWTKHCYAYTVEQKRERKRALEKQGLLEAYDSLETYLQSHLCIRKIDCDTSKAYPAPYELIERNLSYGYKLSGFEMLEDAILWEITTYERPIKQNDCIRNMDTCYLMFQDGRTVEVARRIDYEWLCGNDIPEGNYETYRNQYVAISDIPSVGNTIEQK